MKIKIFTGSTPEDVQNEYNEWMDSALEERRKGNMRIGQVDSSLSVGVNEQGQPVFYLLTQYSFSVVESPYIR